MGKECVIELESGKYLKFYRGQTVVDYIDEGFNIRIPFNIRALYNAIVDSKEAKKYYEMTKSVSKLPAIFFNDKPIFSVFMRNGDKFYHNVDLGQEIAWDTNSFLSIFWNEKGLISFDNGANTFSTGPTSIIKILRSMVVSNRLLSAPLNSDQIPQTNVDAAIKQSKVDKTNTKVKPAAEPKQYLPVSEHFSALREFSRWQTELNRVN